MPRGIVTKGIGGFYFVDTGESVFRARGRGVLKRNKALIIVGDEVEATPPLPGDDDGVITKVYPRKNSFARPPVSNLDKMIVVFSVSDPEPNLEVIDRLLVMAESKSIEPIVCINKSDLDDENVKSKVNELKSIYEIIYPTVVTCCLDEKGDSDQGIDELKKLISGSRVALAGPSGVGKSSLTNILIPEAEMETGEISDKTSRGRHTTRHVEIFKLGDSYVYDTPGFTSFDLDGIEESDLQFLFPEIGEASEKCKFRNCFHLKEPDCNVVLELEKGTISESRYNSYVSSLNEIRDNLKY